MAEVEDIRPLSWVLATSEKAQRVAGKTKKNHIYLLVVLALY